jgi:hypothetical protein
MTASEAKKLALGTVNQTKVTRISQDIEKAAKAGKFEITVRDDSDIIVEYFRSLGYDVKYTLGGDIVINWK